jgi:hypothetical protein
LPERLCAVARPGETADLLLEMAVSEFIARRERAAAQWEAAKARAQEELNGPSRPHAESMALAYQRLGVPQPPPRTAEEIEALGQAAWDALSPEQIAELERLKLA